MSTALDPAVQALVDAGNLVRLDLIRFDIPGKTVGYHRGGRPFTYNGLTYLPNRWLQPSGFTGALGTAVTTRTIVFRYAPSIDPDDVIATIESYDYLNAPVIITTLAGDPATVDLAEPLRSAADRLRGLACWVRQEGRDPRDGAAGATDLLRLTALVAYGWMWGLTAGAAVRRPEGYDPAFLDARIGLARFFMSRLLPETAMLEARIRSGYAGLDAALSDRLEGIAG